MIRPLALMATSLLLLSSLLSSCRAERDSSALTIEGLAGEYGGFGGRIGLLILTDDGTYSCFVMNGTVNGCSSVFGSGLSTGTWLLEDGKIGFSWESEPDELVLSFEAATAIPSATGLVLSVEGIEYPLKKALHPVFGSSQE